MFEPVRYYINRKEDVLVIGLGSVGSFLAMGLSRIANVVGCDHDKVEADNLYYQLYTGEGYKAEAIKNWCNGTFYIDKFQDINFGEKPFHTVFVAADDKEIPFIVKDKVKFKYLIDTRVGIEAVTSICVKDKHFDKYLKYWEENTGKSQELMCYARGMIDISFLASSIAINQYRRALKDEINFEIIRVLSSTYIINIEREQ